LLLNNFLRLSIRALVAKI